MAYPLGLGFGDAAPTPSGIEHGQDIEVPDGTALYAPVPGIVVVAGELPPIGGAVGIYSAGHTFWFGHLKQISVHIGQQVSQGTYLGLSGGAAGDPMRGDATGAHLWYGVSTGRQTELNQLTNPLPFLNQDSIFSTKDDASWVAGAVAIQEQSGGLSSSQLAKPWGTVHIPFTNDDIPLGSYLKVFAGGVIMLVGVILILVASGLRSGAVGSAAESVPVAGPVVRRARRASSARVRARRANVRDSQANELREFRKQGRENQRIGRSFKGTRIDLDAENKAFRAQRIKELSGG
jgi:hypothetical protein